MKKLLYILIFAIIGNVQIYCNQDKESIQPDSICSISEKDQQEIKDIIKVGILPSKFFL